MILDTLQIQHIRNWQQASFSFSPTLNFIVGPNGAGKSALLEAIFLLAHPFTFRTNNLKTLLSHQAESVLLTASLSRVKGERLYYIGIERQRDKSVKMRLNSEPVQRLSDIAELLPIRTCHPDSHLLVSGSPQYRRSCLDWGVFHVEHFGRFPWREYKKALSLRNTLLRSAYSEREKIQQLSSWDKLLTEKGNLIHQARQDYVVQLTEVLNPIFQSLGFEQEISLELQPGWNAQQSLQQALLDSRDRSLQQKTTLVGPHRADLVFRYHGMDVRHVFSRGQIKLLVFATLLAQCLLLARKTEKHAIFLIDDLHSELDDENYQRCLKACENLPLQLFVSETLTTEKTPLLPNARVFHVEHGAVKQVL